MRYAKRAGPSSKYRLQHTEVDAPRFFRESGVMLVSQLFKGLNRLITDLATAPRSTRRALRIFCAALDAVAFWCGRLRLRAFLKITNYTATKKIKR